MAGMLGLQRAIYETIEAKTASYYVRPGDVGKLFTTRGAGGGVTFYLPKMTDIETGWNARFFNVADQDMIISAIDADSMVVFNDAAADSIAYSTAGEQIGAAVEVVYDGTGWLVFNYLSAEAVTSTIVTA